MDDDEEIYFDEYKVVLIGESGVGKTCIIKSFINEKFKENEKPTVSAEYTEKIMEFNGKKIQFNIWDTVGQERFRSVTKTFYNNVKVAILVYDITRGKSFEEIKNFWYDDIKTYSPQNKSLYN